jgi:hypothetical protein
VTVFLDGARLVVDRTFTDLTAGASFVTLFLALGLLIGRELWAIGAAEQVRRRLPILTVLALPLVLLTAATIVARFVELSS